MSTALVFLVYGCSFALALVLLYFFHARWYWHVLSIAAAFAIGMYPPPEQWAGPKFDLLLGFLFVFLFVWGVGEIFFHRIHRARGARRPRTA